MNIDRSAATSTPIITARPTATRFRLSAVLLAFAGAIACLGATNYYVDGPGGAGPGGNDNNDGLSPGTAWATLGKANAVLQAGDTVFVRGGDYSGQKIDPANSGTSANGGTYITYKAHAPDAPLAPRITNPPATTVGSTNDKTAIVLDGNSYIIVDGLHVDGEGLYTASNVDHWAILLNASHNIIRNCDFRYALGYKGLEIDGGSTYNQILDNTMDLCGTYDSGGPSNTDVVKGDLLTIEEGAEFNLIAGNTLTRGGHNILVVEGRGNRITNNYFNNDWSELRPNTGYRSVVLTAKNGSTAGRNLFDNNILTGTRQAVPDNRVQDPQSMKIEGTGQIVRMNLLFDNDFEVFSSVVRASAIDSARNHRIYNNTVTNNGGVAWRLQNYDQPGSAIGGNIFTNNLVFDNRQGATQGNNQDVDVFMTAGDGFDVLQDNLIVGNSILKTNEANGGDAMIYVKTDGGRNSIEWFQANKAANFAQNIEQDPDFVPANGPRDQPAEFELSTSNPASPLIDAGRFLTKTVATSGNTASLQVLDAGYFFGRLADAGISISSGDNVKVGANAPVEVLSVDYGTNTLTLASAISWSGGQANVSLPYNGSAPDIGARESGGGGGGGGEATEIEFTTAMIVASSGDPVTTIADGNTSGGNFVRFDASAAGDFVTFDVNVPATADYQIAVRFQNNSSRGIYQLAINGVNQGAALDLWSASPSYPPPADLGTITLSAGTHVFKFTCLGTSHTGFWLGVDTVVLTPQGNSVPNITTITLPGTIGGESYSQTLAATGGNGALVWSLDAGALPPGLSVSSAGAISGSATTAGTYAFTMRVADSDGVVGPSDEDTQALSIVVTANSVPNITTTTLPDATVDVAYSQTLAATGGNGALVWSVDSGSLPLGLSLSSAGVISGTPDSAGTSNFTVRVADGDGVTGGGDEDTQALSIVVVNSGTLVTFVSQSARDGWVLESGENTNAGGTINSSDATSAALRAGDDAAKKQYKFILSFDTSSLPDAATIVSATLKVKRGTQSGSVAALGTLYADQKTYNFNSNANLENADFNAASNVAQAATMSLPTSNGQLAVGNLTAAGLNAVNKVGNTQFRIYFSVDDDNDTAADYIGFYSGDDSTPANRPVLEVVYQ